MPGIYIIFLVVFLTILALVLWLWLKKRMMGTRRAAILITAIPPALLAIATIVFALLNKEELRRAEGFTIADISAFVGFGLVAVAILSSVVFAIMRKWEIAKGTAYGSGIGFVVCLIIFIVVLVGL